MSTLVPELGLDGDRNRPSSGSDAVDQVQRRVIVERPAREDLVLFGVTKAAAAFALILMAAIGAFLLIKAWPALSQAGFSFLTETNWLPDVGEFGVASLLSGTVTIAGIAMLFAIPVSFCSALFITEYAPRRVRRALISLVDLMAAVPSIVYGLWGFFFLQPLLIGVSAWLSTYLGPVLPFLQVEDPDTPSSFTSSAFIAGAVVSLMVVPTATTVMREVFSQTPIAEREAAYALGATRWSMVRNVVIPFGRSGVVAGSMLGLGRALGETIAVYLIISPIFEYTTHPLQSGSNTIAALIASRASESSEFAMAALLGAGLVLFISTLIVNSIASVVVARSRSGLLTEI
ncbi:MAG: phosphate ABC transporter permease subunit PstC [Actinomycetes bacterium]